MWNLAKILTDLFFVINGVQMQRKQGVLAMGWEVKLLLRKKNPQMLHTLGLENQD